MTVTTTILNFHPAPRQSKANRALAAAAAVVDGVEVIDMGDLYPDIRELDTDREVARLLAAERLVLQFPIYWYAPPPLLAAWQNAVLTRMFYIRAAEEGEAIRGLPLMIAATAGNAPAAYRPGAINGFELEDLLHPLAATASRCGLAWHSPFLLYLANKLDDAELQSAGLRYAEHIRNWTATKAKV